MESLVEIYDEEEIAHILIHMFEVEEGLAIESAKRAYYWVDLGQTPTEIAEQIHSSLDH